MLVDWLIGWHIDSSHKILFDIGAKSGKSNVLEQI